MSHMPVTVAVYRRSSSEPECELIAGQLIAKPGGTLEHMNMERRLLRLLAEFESRGLGQAMHELSFRHGDEVRIPDVVFFRNDARFEDGILIDPPLLCVEVLSPSQRLSELFAKCETYHVWDVSYCWVIDPVLQAAWEYHARSP